MLVSDYESIEQWHGPEVTSTFTDVLHRRNKAQAVRELTTQWLMCVIWKSWWCHSHALNIWCYKILGLIWINGAIFARNLTLVSHSETKYRDLSCPFFSIFDSLLRFCVFVSSIYILFCSSSLCPYVFCFPLFLTLLSSSVIFTDPKSGCVTDTKSRLWGFALPHCLHVFILQLLLPAPSVWLQVMTEFAAFTHDAAVMPLTPPPLSPSPPRHCLSSS